MEYVNYALAFYIYKDLVEFSDMSDDDFWLMTKMDALREGVHRKINFYFIRELA